MKTILRKLTELTVVLLIAQNGLADTPLSQLIDLPLEALTNVEITSAGRKEQFLKNTSSSIYVLSHEDIQRSGATNIPDLLRLVPGLQVATGSAHQWAISSRGFNSLFAEHVLVLIDGVSIYNSAFSGVYWDEWDLVLDDIERIEVIRGPGSVAWGSNGVNGVISIITRAAMGTEGNYLAAGLGSRTQGVYEGRVSESFDESRGNYRLSLKHSTLDSTKSPTGTQNFDAWERVVVNFRSDYALSESEDLTFHANVTRGDRGHQYLLPLNQAPFREIVTDKGLMSNWNVTGRYTHRQEGGEFSLQGYFIHSRRDDVAYFIENKTADLDFQHRFAPAIGHEIVWGLGIRSTQDDSRATDIISLKDKSKNFNLYSLFIQDEFEAGIEGVKVILGTKFEQHDLGNFTFQPSARFVSTLSETNTLWGAISRAIRSPSRVDKDVLVRGPISFDSSGSPTMVEFSGSPSFEQETTYFYELGFRHTPRPWAVSDLSLFFADYDDLRTFSVDSPMLREVAGVSTTVIPRTSKGTQNATSFGLELVQDLRPQEWWRIQLGYALLYVDFTNDQGTNGIDPDDNGSAPHHQVLVRSGFDLSDKLQLDSSFRFIDGVTISEGGTVPSYSALNIRLGYRLTPQWELSIVGEDLLESTHEEFAPRFPKQPASQIKRAALARLAWRF